MLAGRSAHWIFRARTAANVVVLDVSLYFSGVAASLAQYQGYAAWWSHVWVSPASSEPESSSYCQAADETGRRISDNQWRQTLITIIYARTCGVPRRLSLWIKTELLRCFIYTWCLFISLTIVSSFKVSNVTWRQLLTKRKKAGKVQPAGEV